MFFLHFYKFSRLSYLLALILVLPLVACSGGDGGSASAPNMSASNVLGVSWSAPLFREDGTDLALRDIAEYRVYYGTETGDYQNQEVIDGHSTLEVQLSGVPSGTYYVVVTAVDADGRESIYSAEVVITV